MPKWLRITMYVLACVMGYFGAAWGYSKALTLLAIMSVAIPIEVINYFARRRTPNP